MILGSHNSWSYLPVKRWWMKLIAFTAKCQRKSIDEQYKYCGVRCFDLRIRFNKDNSISVAHGLIEYSIDKEELFNQLQKLSDYGDVLVRVLHEVRSEKAHTDKSIALFKAFCIELESSFKGIRFWCGKNLADWKNDYNFGPEPSCLELYASVSPPKLIDDWWPWLYAKLNNKAIKSFKVKEYILLIDYVDIG